VETEKSAKKPWWKFWGKKETPAEAEPEPSDSAPPQQTNPPVTSNAPRNDRPAPDRVGSQLETGSAETGFFGGKTSSSRPDGSTSAYQENAGYQQNAGNSHIQTATGMEMKPTAQADIQTPQYDWSQSRKDSMRAGNLPGQRPFLEYDGAKIWAKVENAVILESDVEAGVKKRIAKMQREAKKNGAPPLTENDLQREIQQWQVQVLQELIQHQIMFTRACSSIPREGLESAKTAIDKAFDDKQLPVMIKEYGVASQWELEQALKAEGSCIENEKKKFFEQSVGFQWLQMQADPVKEIRHDQIMDYYKEHLDQYTITPKARWEELVVFKYNFPSREEAYKAIQKMGQAVVAGKPFVEVAKQSSQGVTASEGGKRDWVSPGALNSEPLNKALFEQPVGDLSPRIIEDENCFYIVRVLERHGKKIISFEEAQTEIRKKLTEQQEEENRKKAFEKVFKDAKVWTVFEKSAEDENDE
ncbi:MAG: peptidylprolyl isomerase, partial [Thermoguttaceae bacterium]|nr:peptidylprolyl isomerase [Thermoguttaceae bacterium]